MASNKDPTLNIARWWVLASENLRFLITNPLMPSLGTYSIIRWNAISSALTYLVNSGMEKLRKIQVKRVRLGMLCRQFWTTSRITLSRPYYGSPSEKPQVYGGRMMLNAWISVIFWKLLFWSLMILCLMTFTQGQDKPVLLFTIIALTLLGHFQRVRNSARVDNQWQVSQYKIFVS